MPYCAKCGSEVEEEDRFCRNCGAELKTGKLKKKEKKGKIKAGETLGEEEIKARLKLKKELEEAIKALKSGKITVEEFQKKKKEIAEKLKLIKLGVKIEEVEKEKKESGELIEAAPVEEAKPQRKVNFKKAAIIIVALILLSSLAFGIYSFKDKILASQEVGEKGIKPISQPEELNETLEKPSLRVLENINLKPADFGEDAKHFIIEEKYTGYIKDPLEFAEGDEKLAENLSSRGWKENHRIVMKKVIDNETMLEIDSSLSRYNLSRAENFTLKDLLDEKINELKAQGYNISGASLDDTSIIAKKVEKIKDSNDVFVYYTLAFYKKDIFAELKVKGIVRKVNEEDVIKYGNIIAGRI